ncbi:erythromycin esterase family protein [Vibrio vulnificus]|uniref:erythromycin esterase family protein n=1 Tax=Vibrio vulnificus TaxID=672 RepID=UPI0019D4667C|nr:erythromycin esterase family protein [Vibrio vulnificus]MBN8095684.1 erythromycin esterase family protein [Vibrio vulnificus]HAS6055648.1 erythromycin esterase [Vibrio vulnificus]
MHRATILTLALLSGCQSDTDPEISGIEHQALLSSDLHSSPEDLTNFLSATQSIDIISVGERTHQGSKAYSYKARMAKALYEEGNLNLIAFEAGLYDGLAAWQNYLRGTQTLPDAVIGPNANYMYGHRFSQEVATLLAYVNDVPQREKPLLLIGYDARINSDPGCSVMFDELENYLIANDLGGVNYSKFKETAPRMMCPWYATHPYSQADHLFLVNQLKILESQLAQQKQREIVPSYSPDTPREFRHYASFWLQIVRSLRSQAYFIINNIDNEYTNAQSAENLHWLINEWFQIKGQTFVWAHNIHATPVEKSLISALNQRYPQLSTYSVMQLGYRGPLAANTPDYRRWLKETETFQEEAQTLNSALYSAGYPDTFVDLTSQPNSSIRYFQQFQYLRYAWGGLTPQIPSSIMDGFLFIPIEKPAQPVQHR